VGRHRKWVGNSAPTSDFAAGSMRIARSDHSIERDFAFGRADCAGSVRDLEAAPAGLLLKGEVGTFTRLYKALALEAPSNPDCGPGRPAGWSSED